MNKPQETYEKTYIPHGMADGTGPTFKQFCKAHWMGFVALALIAVSALKALLEENVELALSRLISVGLLYFFINVVWTTTKHMWLSEQSNAILFRAYIQQCNTTTQMARELMSAQEEVQRLKKEAQKP